MTEAVILALIAQVGTLVTLIITTVFGRRKLNDIHTVVNGTSSEQRAKIEEQARVIRQLEKELVRVKTLSGKDGQ